jgi:hypothetical protein
VRRARRGLISLIGPITSISRRQSVRLNRETGENMATTHTHTKDCPDRKAAAADRAAHEAAAKKREVLRQGQAHAQWFDTHVKIR